MKVLLVLPPLTTRLYSRDEHPTVYTPLGMGYLAAVAREAGHQPLVLDCLAEGIETRQKRGEMTRYGLTKDEIEKRIRDFDPDFVGITCMFSGFDRDCRETAAIAKRVKPNVPVVLGGADATAQADELVKDPNVDLIVRGEGEQVLLELLTRIEQDAAMPEDLPGTTTPNRSNPLGESIADLDSIPFPARDLLSMHLYLQSGVPAMPYAKRQPVGFIMSSRGCPFKCIFCSTRNMWTGWRPRSPQSIVDEIEVLVRDYGVREVAFLDDSFIVKPERIKLMCEELIKRRIRISWSVPVGLTVWKVTEDILRTMRDSGFYRACFPIESGDPEMLKYIRKPVDLNRVLETIETCHRLGIWTYGNFIIGFPEQTPESVETTIKFAESCGLDMINAYIAQPYRGAELWDIMDDMGLLASAHGEGSTILDTTYDTRFLTAQELIAKRAELCSRFTQKRIRRLFTPKGIVQMLRKMRTPASFAYAVRVFAKFAKNSLMSRKFTIIPE